MKKFFLLAMLILVGIVSAYAQQTAYEKKVEEICAKYYCYGTYGYNAGLSMEDKLALGMFGFEGAARLSLANYILKYDAKQGKKWIDSMEKELEKAKSLMTDADFYKLFLKTSYGRVMMQVKDDFDNRFVKDEFETQSQFQARVKTEAAQVYDRLCSKIVALMNSTLQITISPKSYDAEKCVYNVEVEELFKLSEQKEIKNSYEKSIPMKSDVARQYKGESIKPESIMNIAWVTNDDEIHAQEVKYIDDNGVNKIFIANFSKYKPLVFDYDKYKETNPLLPGHVWKSSDLKNYYETYVKKMNKTIDEFNQKIINDKYYDSIRSRSYFLKTSNYSISDANKYDEAELQKTLNYLIKSLITTDYYHALEKMSYDCRKYNPDKYIEIYESEHPDFESKVAKLESDYRCYNWSYNKLAFFVIDDIAPSETKCYDKYIELFNKREEFDSYYDDAVRFNKEVSARDAIRKKYISVKEKISQESSLAFKGAKDGKKANLVSYINDLEEFKIVDYWYNSTLDAYFNADAKMAKEYDKVGSLFKNKKEFFEAYISPDYKKILKSKK